MNAVKAVMNTRSLIRAQRVVWSNASALFGTTVLAAPLGFLFWWAVARHFPPTVVGYGSSAISALVMLGNLGALGVSTVVIGELAKRGRSAAPVTVAGVYAAVAVSIVLGSSAALVGPRLVADVSPLAQALFVAGVALTGAAYVLDAAVVGMLAGSVQMSRNVVFHVVKFGFLLLIVVALSQRVTTEILLAWVVGVAVSVVWAVALLARRGVWLACRPDRTFLRALPRAASAHNGVNLGLEASMFVPPIIATACVSPAEGASFYAAWMILAFAYILPFHFGTALFAAGTEEAPGAMRRRLRFSLGVSGIAGLIGIPLLVLLAPVGLWLFGPTYVEQGTTPLRLIALGYFPMVLWAHFVALCRIHARIGFAAAVVLTGTALELGAAVFGAAHWGLVGLAMGLLVVKVVEGLATAPTVWRAWRAEPVQVAEPERSRSRP